MKTKSILTIAFLLLALPVLAQDDVTVVSASSEAGDGLDLTAVGELFKESETLEAFERAINDPDTGINNLDLDSDGNVDYLRVMEESAEETRVIVIQAALGEDDYQDVATIEIEKTGEESYNLQVHGDETVYGPDVYYAPAVVHVHTWPLVRWLYGPAHRPYRSVFVWGHNPHWWRPRPVVAVHVYRPRVAHYSTRHTFVVRKTTTVRTVHKVHRQPGRSAHVRKTVTVKKTTTVKRPVAKPVRKR